MKIVLAEEQSGRQTREISFQQDTVRIGRDPKDCQIVFDNQNFPMVSRRHAELKVQNGQWVLFDLGSSYGTFLNGQKVVQPQIVSVGSAIQLGTNGPVLIVVWIEMPSANFSPVGNPQDNFSKPISAPLPPPDLQVSAALAV